MKMGHIGINYTELKGGYKGVEARVREVPGKEYTKVFASGDPSADFANATMWMTTQDVEAVTLSSSCDHFPHDVKGWGWYQNGVLGELIKPIKDKSHWRGVPRQYGTNQGRSVHIQVEGNFIILDNKDAILLLSPDGEVKAPNGKFNSVDEAKEYCIGLKRSVQWQ